MRIVLRGKVPLATDVVQEMAKWEARRLDVISALYVQPSLKGTFWEEYEVWGGNKQSKGKTSQCCLLQRQLGWRTRHVSREYLNQYDTVGFINLLLHLNQIFTRGRLLKGNHATVRPLATGRCIDQEDSENLWALQMFYIDLGLFTLLYPHKVRMFIYY